ncbi:MAG: hypothetical protein U5L96_18040 [Owenweeksia sp.]|nr:hypothetical protein [Owenweeksia sp.]
MLVAIDERFASRMGFAQGKMENFDAVIATGSNNSARHSDYDFGKYPNIIRKNRTSVAVLTGDEPEEELKKPGKTYFAILGWAAAVCLKIYLPQGYNLDRLFASILSL